MKRTIEFVTRENKYSKDTAVYSSDLKKSGRKLFIRHSTGENLIKFDSNVYRILWDKEKDYCTSYKVEFVKSAKEFDEDLKKEKQLPKAQAPKIFDMDAEAKHYNYETIKTCIAQDIPVYLVGPAGSGKNFTLEQIAKELELDFYFTNSIQQEYKITGFIDAGGKYNDTEFYKAFTQGGMFFLDEMDASIPEVLVLLNAAIANKYFEFPNGKVNAHPDFRVVSAGNTVGSGADEQYTGRLVLDQATLDRFVILEFGYDINIEMKLAKGNTELVNFVRNLRQQSEELGIRTTFSYRCITMVTKLEGKLKLTDILQMAVFKGLDQDTINTFKVKENNKYYQAQRNLQS